MIFLKKPNGMATTWWMLQQLPLVENEVGWDALMQISSVGIGDLSFSVYE